ncbi:MAG: MFS transporter [Candidatus Eisenbacteria bacterium]|jgi:MFS family permease|nr:MFS transporter [Candidatus Eisenbacteria bacterium]
MPTHRRIPHEHRSNFRNLYWDITWFGVSAASAMAFLSVYAARLSATELQIGLISAGPAAVNVLFTLPSGWWIERRPVGSAVFWTSLFHRVFYFLWILVPLLAAHQVKVLIWLVLAMSVPGTALAVGFNALFAAAVPPEFRGHVVGVRNGLFALAFIVVSLLAGRILDTVAFPLSYQIVFAVGAVGAAMSSVHLYRIRIPSEARPFVPRASGDLAWPGMVRLVVDGLRPGAAQRVLVRKPAALIRAELLKGSYGALMGAVFALHVALFLAVPLFPIHWVRNLGLSDGQIGLGTATFYVSVLAGSALLSRLVARIGNQRLSAVGVLFMSTYPALMGASSGLELFLGASALGGFGWSLVGGALTNYVLEKVPSDDRPAHLAWYNMAMNAGLLCGSLLGPMIALPMGMVPALMVFAVCRLASAALIWRLR